MLLRQSGIARAAPATCEFVGRFLSKFILRILSLAITNNIAHRDDDEEKDPYENEKVFANDEDGDTTDTSDSDDDNDDDEIDTTDDDTKQESAVTRKMDEQEDGPSTSTHNRQADDDGDNETTTIKKQRVDPTSSSSSSSTHGRSTSGLSNNNGIQLTMADIQAALQIPSWLWASQPVYGCEDLLGSDSDNDLEDELWHPPNSNGLYREAEHDSFDDQRMMEEDKAILETEYDDSDDDDGTRNVEVTFTDPDIDEGGYHVLHGRKLITHTFPPTLTISSYYCIDI
jgi:hypothetical protein